MYKVITIYRGTDFPFQIFPFSVFDFNKFNIFHFSFYILCSTDVFSITQTTPRPPVIAENQCLYIYDY